jgi:hypothetical protein
MKQQRRNGGRGPSKRAMVAAKAAPKYRPKAQTKAKGAGHNSVWQHGKGGQRRRKERKKEKARGKFWRLTEGPKRRGRCQCQCEAPREWPKWIRPKLALKGKMAQGEMTKQHSKDPLGEKSLIKEKILHKFKAIFVLWFHRNPAKKVNTINKFASFYYIKQPNQPLNLITKYSKLIQSLLNY